MKIGKQARRDGKALFQACCVNGLLDEYRVRQAVTRLIERRPRGYLATLSYFQRLVKLDLDRRTARVENAIETAPEQRAAIAASLQQRYGPGLSLTYETNPALIGGLRVRVGSDVYDGSVAGRLAALQAGL
jgi:F-type H+-transporting ATPase subunit delta